MVSNSSGEKSFSMLKHIKSELLSTISPPGLIYLSVMSIESELLQKVDINDMINDYANLQNL